MPVLNWIVPWCPSGSVWRRKKAYGIVTLDWMLAAFSCVCIVASKNASTTCGRAWALTLMTLIADLVELELLLCRWNVRDWQTNNRLLYQQNQQ
jgi:hypothetical protein